MSSVATILVTGFEPFGPHKSNPSDEVARVVDGLDLGTARTRSVILPVDHRAAFPIVRRAIEESDPIAVVHLGLAEGRARIALERVAVNVMDFSRPDNAGYQALDEPCVPGGRAAYLATLPLRAILDALVAAGIPAYVSNTAGTYLCNHVLYSTLHALATTEHPARAGFVHLPLSPAMVALSGIEQPSMDVPLMIRAIEVVLTVVASTSAATAR